MVRRFARPYDGAARGPSRTGRRRAPERRSGTSWPSRRRPQRRTVRRDGALCAQLEREEFEEIDVEFIEDKIASSPIGVAYRSSYAWILAGRGDTERAREELHATMALLHAFDANWLSLQAECAEACVLIGDDAHTATLYERLLPFAGRPATAGRGVTSYGAVDRLLGDLAELLGRQDEAVRHLDAAIRQNASLGCIVWQERAERRLSRIVH